MKMSQRLTKLTFLKQVPPAMSCFLGGMLMGMASDPLNAWFLAWIALIPLWIWLLQQPQFHISQLLPACTFAVGYYGVTLFWITGIHPMTWMGVPWVNSLLIAIFCWLFLIVWGSIFVFMWSLAMMLVTRSLSHPLSRVLLGVAFWCAIETLISYTPLHWPTFALTQSPYNLPILQWLSLSGTTTVTAAIVAVNGLLAEAIRLRRSALSSGLIQLAIALFAGLHLIGWLVYLQPLETPQENALRVGIIQGNVPNTIKLAPEGWRKAREGYTTGYIELAQAGAEVVLTPETALPFQWEQQVCEELPSESNSEACTPRGNSPLYQTIQEENIPVWLGAFGKKEGRSTNSLYSLNGNGETLARFDKVKLVPLGEYIPFENIVGNVVGRLSPLNAQLTSGSADQTFITPWGKAAVGICYESAYAEHFRRQVTRGGAFLLSASNDDHYSEVMPAQHHAQDVMRAIETDRFMVRATNTGYSGIVDSHGNTLWLSELYEYQTHLSTIYLRDSKTLYVRWGNWLNWMLLGLGGAILAKSWLKRLSA